MEGKQKSNRVELRAKSNLISYQTNLDESALLYAASSDKKAPKLVGAFPKHPKGSVN